MPRNSLYLMHLMQPKMSILQSLSNTDISYCNAARHSQQAITISQNFIIHKTSLRKGRLTDGSDTDMQYLDTKT